MATKARLAPSPTGPLHIGHARSFLLAWLNSKSKDGEVLLRLEDLDTSRARAEHVADCIEDLKWLGLDWDGDPLLQSSRAEDLMSIAVEMVSRREAYPCVCTRKDVREAISAPHMPNQTSRYPGTCRDRFSSIEAARSDTGRQPTIRYHCPVGEVQVTDAIAGEITLNPEREFGDFPIASPDGQVSYHLAVVLDDHHQEVTEVLRGDDLLGSCGPQAVLQSALGIQRPEWIHVPLVLDDRGERLAKRSDSLSISSLREAGVDSRRLVQWLMSESGMPITGPSTPLEALPAYKLSLLNPEPLRVPADIQAILGKGSTA